MLVVKVAIWPHGDENISEDVLELFVANDGTGGGEGSETGNYDVYIEDPRGKPRPRHEREGWIGRIENYPRTGRNKSRDLLAAEALRLASMSPEAQDAIEEGTMLAHASARDKVLGPR